MKRLTDTEVWRAPWFMALKPKHKLLWRWLCDRCDNAGMVEIHWGLASFEIGMTLDESDMNALDGRVMKVHGDKWNLPKFVAFQFGELHQGSRVHQSVLKLIASHKDRDSNGYGIPCHSVKDKDKDKDKDSVGESEGGASPYTPDFEAFWTAYPRKVGKGAAWKAWKAAKPPQDAVIAAVAAQRTSLQWTKDRGQFIPHPSTWLNQRRWEDAPDGEGAAAREPVLASTDAGGWK